VPKSILAGEKKYSANSKHTILSFMKWASIFVAFQMNLPFQTKVFLIYLISLVACMVAAQLLPQLDFIAGWQEPENKITVTQALDQATGPLKEFMLKQTRTRDLEYFLELGGFGPTAVKDLPIRVVIPAFVISELQTAFQMGFLLFLPFLVIDFLVSSVLMALGMMMMPPVTVALPLKLLLFVLVDGWHLVVRSLVQSCAT